MASSPAPLRAEAAMEVAPRFQRSNGYKLEPKHQLFAIEEAQRWLELGYCRRATAQKRKKVLRLGNVSPGFVTSSAGKLWLVIDYSAVNECLEERTFRMDQLGDLAAFFGPGDALFKADISDAYYHLRIRSCDRERLAFQVESVVYLPLCLNCGLAVAPWFFTKAMRPVVSYLRARPPRLRLSRRLLRRCPQLFVARLNHGRHEAPRRRDPGALPETGPAAAPAQVRLLRKQAPGDSRHRGRHREGTVSA